MATSSKLRIITKSTADTEMMIVRLRATKQLKICFK